MPYLLDSDWVIDALAKKRAVNTILERLSPDGIAISIISVGELYEGAFGSSDPQGRLALLREFLDSFTTIGLDDAMMERFAALRNELRRSGQLLPDFDLLIATTALHHDLTLLTFNLRHFGRIAGLKLYTAPPTQSLP